ncbi:hypothetical protein [Peribacillus kribbensis]|uniref:hypothetical protein n=1 Tax=Peribacillus kribbensis TaxID=356658 RepID=UPI0003F9D21C|nr:hypothetical protein [Peribacillus kribbensis]
MNNKLRYQKEYPPAGLRVEFGTELTGDMNASKIYDITQASKKERNAERTKD